MAPTRLLHCSPLNRDGGVGVLTATLLQGLRAPAFVHHVLSLSAPEESHAGALPCEAQHAAHTSNIPTEVRLISAQRFRAAIAAARAFDPDVVRGATLEGNLVAAAVGAACRKPVIFEQHGDGSDRNWKAHLLAGFSAHVAARCLSVSDEVDDYLGSILRVPQRKRVVIHNGVRDPALLSERDRIDLLSDIGVPNNTVVIGMVCRLHDHIKRVSDAIESLHLITNDFPNVRLLIVGEGPDRRSLEQLSEELVPGRVTFIGEAAPADPYYSLMDVFLISSATEGSPLTVAEAMHAGLPVIATRVGGLQSMVAHEKTGLLVNPSDPQELAAAMRRLVEDEPLRRSLGRHGQQRAHAEYSQERYCADFSALVLSVKRR